MENIEVQRSCFDKIRVVFVRVHEGEKLGKSLGEIVMKDSDQNENNDKKNRNPVTRGRYALQTLKHKTALPWMNSLTRFEIY